MGKKKGMFLLVCIVTAVFSLTGCSTVSSTKASRTSTFFDTVITIDIYDKHGEELLDECMKLCTEYENKFSRTKEGSEIYQLNHAGGAPVELSPETIEVIQLGLNYSSLSQGKFDITIAPLSDLWDFQSGSGIIPDDASIANAKSHVNFQNVVVADHTVQLTDPEAAIDLGGIAKGYIADKLKEYLKEQGVRHALINLGGNILALGGKPDGTSYNIGVQYPFKEDGTPITTVKLKDRSLVSSGVYQRYIKKEDQLYHHILNPATGYPCTNGLLGVTILCDSSANADGLSTTCFVLGLDEGMKLINQTSNVEAIFITSDYKLHYSSGFRK